MTDTRRLKRALLVLLAAISGSGAYLAADATGPARARPPVVPKAFASATTPLRGRLTPVASAKLKEVDGGSVAILVLLDPADIRVCEDLGHQLRKLVRRAGAAFPLVFVVDSAALTDVRTFARREHLQASGFIGLRADAVIVEKQRVPTPAALVIQTDKGDVVGVGHPRRFPNVRVRSFADELSAYLPDRRGVPSPPTSWRFP
jgi:hypothetical protein